MVLRAKEIREQIFRQNFPSLVRSKFLFTEGWDLAIQPAEMDKRISYLLAWDRSVQDQQPPRKNLSTGVATIKEEQEKPLAPESSEIEVKNFSFKVRRYGAINQ